MHLTFEIKSIIIIIIIIINIIIINNTIEVTTKINKINFFYILYSFIDLSDNTLRGPNIKWKLLLSC